ncbi:uncharacterized protein LOC113374018 [Ctenocephalides felis]|uniref:uncharacterized protein LOC113374018 n=1 Tax=Ctenocephalides felis TaxID=7515 RepID=UPI000E6E5B9F|nr:uncharacterized protein LOC113374018 [Ctenocephalides felis]
MSIKITLLVGFIISTGCISSDDVNEDLCGRIDLDGPVQAIQYKLENLYTGTEKETDSSVKEIKSNFEDLSLKADKISDDCERKTPKLLGFINQMNQAKQCIEALSKRNQAEAQTECQSVHDEAKLNFVVRSVANNAEGYEEILECAHTFTDLVQRVKIYRAILREWDKGDENTNRKFFVTVQYLIKEKNAPVRDLRDILKTIAVRSILDKNLKFTNSTLMNELFDYDYIIAIAVVDELMTKLYNQNKHTAKHLLYLPSIPSRVAASISFYNKTKENIDNDLSKKLFQIMYVTRLHPDFGKVDQKSKQLLGGIMKNLTKDMPNLKGFGEVCFDTQDTKIDENDNKTEQIFVKSASKNDNLHDWQFTPDEKGSILQISFPGEPSTLIFVNKNDYPPFEEAPSFFSSNNVSGNWERLNADDICSKTDYRDFICFDGNNFLSPDAFDNEKIKERKLTYKARKNDRETMCPKI